MNISFKNQDGFSLIEALIALAILTIGLLAIALLQMTAIKGNTNALARTDGVAIAQSTLDTLRCLPLNDNRLTAGAGNLNSGQAAWAFNLAAADHTGGELYPADTIIGPSGQSYTIFWNIIDNNLDADVAIETKTIRVFVYWTDPRFGLNKTIATTTLGGLYL
nr:prepilin-type N-terminal cleavage/methylation domain-containing protein [uncultured Desulfuromonas sp.]